MNTVLCVVTRVSTSDPKAGEYNWSSRHITLQPHKWHAIAFEQRPAHPEVAVQVRQLLRHLSTAGYRNKPLQAQHQQWKFFHLRKHNKGLGFKTCFLDWVSGFCPLFSYIKLFSFELLWISGFFRGSNLVRPINVIRKFICAIWRTEFVEKYEHLRWHCRDLLKFTDLSEEGTASLPL